MIGHFIAAFDAKLDFFVSFPINPFHLKRNIRSDVYGSLILFSISKAYPSSKYLSINACPRKNMDPYEILVMSTLFIRFAIIKEYKYKN